jgi:hypothetical protein
LCPHLGTDAFLRQWIPLTSLFSTFDASELTHDASPSNGDPVHRSIPPSFCAPPRPRPANPYAPTRHFTKTAQIERSESANLLISQATPPGKPLNLSGFVHPAPPAAPTHPCDGILSTKRPPASKERDGASASHAKEEIHSAQIERRDAGTPALGSTPVPPTYPQCNPIKPQPKLKNWVRFAKNHFTSFRPPKASQRARPP